MNNPAAQDAAFDLYAKVQWSYIENYGLDKHVGQTISGVTITKSGLIAAAHLVGIGDLIKAVEANDLTVSEDGNKIKAKEYMEKFGGYDINGFK